MTNDTRKKILFLITKSNWGGAQRYVFDIASNLDKERFEAVVALGGDGMLAQELKEHHVRIIHIENLVRDISLFRELRAITELWRIIRAERPDVLHINSSKAGGLGALIGRIAQVPSIIFTAHGWAFNEDRSRLSRCLIKVLHACTVLLSHTTVAVSETLKAQLNIPFLQKKMIVIHNGRTITSLLERNEARTVLAEKIPSLSTYKNDFWSVTIGELHKVKQHEVMIRAVAQLVNEQPSLRHIIIGDGQERESLKLLIEMLNVQEHVFLVGSVHEASRLLHAFDLFILPSRSEAFAYVIIEACIAGLPIIASRVGGIPEIITHNESGILCTPGDVNQFTNATAQLIKDETWRTGLADGAKKRSADFTFEKMLIKTTELYESRNSRAV